MRKPDSIIQEAYHNLDGKWPAPVEKPDCKDYYLYLIPEAGYVAYDFHPSHRCGIGLPSFDEYICTYNEFKAIGTQKLDAALTADAVNHPTHYTSHPSGVECISVTEHMNFCLGNAVKYLWRAGVKSSKTHIEDLKKARWYIDREIQRLEKESAK